MNERVQRDIVDILTKAVEIIKAGNPFGLKELSDHTIHNASIFQDKDSISVAVIIYSLSKILVHDFKDKDRFVELLQTGRHCMDEGNQEAYRDITNRLLDMISGIDSKFGHYVDDVINHAQIKKGMKIYDHGISLGQAAEIMGISQWDLMQYEGKTRSGDTRFERPDVIEKIRFARRLFG